MSDTENTETTNETIESSAPETTTHETVETESHESNDKTPLGVFSDKSAPIKNLSKKTSKVGTKVQAKTNEGAPAPVLPEYTPNYKFKVLDQEKEMDEWIRPLVKNKESEEKFRDMLTKAHGLTKIKSERDELRSQYDNFKSQVTKDYAPIVQRHNVLSQIASEGRQNGDWGKFFQAAQIPVQSVIRWAANTVSQLEKNPNYLEQEKNQFQTQQNFQNLQSENQTLKQQMDKIQMQRQELELDYTLKAPDTQGFAQTFDERVGRPGAFRQEVIRRGALIEMTEGRVATTQEIVGDLVKFFGGVPQAPAQQSIAPQEQANLEGTQGVQHGSEGKPVLPNIKGRSSSPAKTMIRSTDDLRKIRNSMMG